SFFWGQTDNSKMRTNRHADILEDAMVFVHPLVVNNNTGIVVDLVDHSVGIGHGNPAVVVDRARPIPVAGGVELIDGDNLAGLRLLDEVVILIAPPRSNVCSKGPSFVLRIGARAHIHIEDAHFENVAWLGACDGDRPGKDVDPGAAASA